MYLVKYIKAIILNDSIDWDKMPHTRTSCHVRYNPNLSDGNFLLSFRRVADANKYLTECFYCGYMFARVRLEKYRDLNKICRKTFASADYSMVNVPSKYQIMKHFLK